MALRGRVRELAEQRLGVTVAPTREIERLKLREQEFADFRNEAEELAFYSLDYFGGRPHEMRPEQRKRLAQRSRIALLADPLAGAEAQLVADFAFGKGVSVPEARDEQVQDVIDRAWTDSNNEEKLTGFGALRKLSNELLSAGELFFTLYSANGRIRVGRLDADVVNAIVPDPEDRLRPLYYVGTQRRYEWDYDLDQPRVVDLQLAANGRPVVKYWAHWRNVDDAKLERELGMTDDETPLEEPPPEKLAKGRVYHVAINQVGEQLRGNPPWQRALRFMSAMNVLTEAHVNMAQAQASLIAKRTMKGSPRTITKAAAAILGQVSEFGTSMFDAPPQPPSGAPSMFAPGAPPPAPPGSWWVENETSKLEAFNLKSGASEAAQSAQIVRAPIAASSGFGQHYLGDASNANLATASTLELPANMRIGGWQEWFEQILRWFTDRAIETAIHNGELGGESPEPGARPLGEMRLQEADERAELERRTGKDLSYEFTMPFPGRRQLPDVTTTVTQVAAAYDPNGVNIPLRRQLLTFLYQQLDIDDVARAVELAIPEKGIPGGIGDPANAPGSFVPKQPGAPGQPPSAGEPPEGQQPYGAKSGTSQPNENTDPGAPSQSQEARLPDGERPAVDELVTQTRRMFRELVRDPTLTATVELVGSANGKR